MRVIVCGGRNYNDEAMVYAMLGVVHKDNQISHLAQGGATGADCFARNWAVGAGVPVSTYPALWELNGKAAGPIRNAHMLRDFRPDLVIAFPGGAGTRNMVELARKAGVEVEEVTE